MMIAPSVSTPSSQLTSYILYCNHWISNSDLLSLFPCVFNGIVYFSVIYVSSDGCDVLMPYIVKNILHLVSNMKEDI